MNLKEAKELIKIAEDWKGRKGLNDCNDWSPFIGYQCDDCIILDGAFHINWLKALIIIMEQDPEHFGSRL